VGFPVPELRRPNGRPLRPSPAVGPTLLPRVPYPEPPALRSAPASSARACVNCHSPVSFRTAPPLCWGCGRTLCVDCYWRHGLTPSAHVCAGCAARGVKGPMTARSGGRATSVRGGGPSPPTFV
jgi:hypothetical protein